MRLFEICRHNEVTIKGGKRTGKCRSCESDFSNETHFVPNLEEKFNVGLGCYTSGTRDAETKAKRRGLVPIGDAKSRDVFKRQNDTRETDRIIEDGMRKVHNLGNF